MKYKKATENDTDKQKEDDFLRVKQNLLRRGSLPPDDIVKQITKLNEANKAKDGNKRTSLFQGLYKPQGREKKEETSKTKNEDSRSVSFNDTPVYGPLTHAATDLPDNDIQVQHPTIPNTVPNTVPKALSVKDNRPVPEPFGAGLDDPVAPKPFGKGLVRSSSTEDLTQAYKSVASGNTAEPIMRSGYVNLLDRVGFNVGGSAEPSGGSSTWFGGLLRDRSGSAPTNHPVAPNAKPKKRDENVFAPVSM